MNVLGLSNRILTIAAVAFIAWSVCIQIRKNNYYKVLLFWLFVPILTLIFLRHPTLEQLFVFQVVGLIIGASAAIEYIKKVYCHSLGTLIAILILFLNATLIAGSLPTNYRIFFQSTQPEFKYKDQRDAVDYVYKKANQRPFYFQSYTIPYFWQDGWEYLFWYTGSTKNLVLPDEKHDELLYVIIQKDSANPRFQYDWYTNTVSTWGKLNSQKIFGELTVEERVKEDLYEQ